MIGPDTECVDIEPLERKPQHVGGADHAMIGQAFAKHGVVGTDKRRQRQEHRMRRAIGNQKRIEGAVDAKPFEPRRGGHAMALEPRYGTAVAHPGLVVFAPQFGAGFAPCLLMRSEEHTSELQSLMRISYAVFCLKKKKYTPNLKL